MKINILGAGSWGISLAYLLSKKNNNILVWTRSEDKAAHYNKTRIYNPDIKEIPNNISFTSDINSLEYNITVIALPSHAVSSIMSLCDFSKNKIVLATKGFDLDTSMLMTDLLTTIHNFSLQNIAVLSGPNHAEEIILNKPTGAVIASKNDNLSIWLLNVAFSDFSSLKFNSKFVFFSPIA